MQLSSCGSAVLLKLAPWQPVWSTQRATQSSNDLENVNDRKIIGHLKYVPAYSESCMHIHHIHKHHYDMRSYDQDISGMDKPIRYRLICRQICFKDS